jgi:hypothetical protein
MNKKLNKIIQPTLIEYFHKSLTFVCSPGYISWRRENATFPISDKRNLPSYFNQEYIEKILSERSDKEICKEIQKWIKKGIFSNPLDNLPSREFSIIKNKNIDKQCNDTDCLLVANSIKDLYSKMGYDKFIERLLKNKDTNKQQFHLWSEYLKRDFPNFHPMEIDFDPDEFLEYSDEEPFFYQGSDKSIGDYIQENINNNYSSMRKFYNCKQRKDPDILIKCRLKCWNLYCVMEEKDSTDRGNSQDLSLNDALSITNLTDIVNDNIIIGIALIDGTPWDRWGNHLYNTERKNRLAKEDLKRKEGIGIIHPRYLRSFINKISSIIKTL